MYMEINNSTLKEMTLEEVQSLQLVMMSKIHEFCVNRNIRYSLGGGTLLGAVRHKGYIPWDDDIDIMLPRPDYDRFINEFVGYDVDLDVQNYNMDPTYPWSWTRVCNNKTILYSQHAIGGIFIDVFPIDGLPEEKDMEEYHKKVLNLKKHVAYTNKFNDDRIERNSVVRYIKKTIKGVLYLGHQTAINRLEKQLRSFPFETSKFAGAIIGMYGPKEQMDAEVFKKYISLPFEGYKFMCIADYDAYLTKHYGDYMQLPPIEKQVTHHRFKTYWKP